jgi:DNA-binding NarL/FixJ family response regulator
VNRPRLHVLLATSSPVIQTFFAEFSEDEVDPFVVDAMPVVVGALKERHHVLTAADVVVVEMEPRDGLTTAIRFCDALHTDRPDLPIIVLVHGPRDVAPWHVRRLFVGEICGLFDLRATTAEMRVALREVASGAVMVRIQGDPEHWVTLRDALTGRQQTGAHVFSEQDTKLMQLSAQGLSEGEIGQRLHLAASTVHHQLEQLRHAVGARNRIELAAWAGLHGHYGTPSPDSVPPERAP